LDQVLVLHNHRIIESRTHDELIAKLGGFYAKLCGMQDQTLEILESDFATE
jgi:ABC-type multidrug transport system fused ATPase/permease subunit